MDHGTLLGDPIPEGRELIDRLIENGVPVTAACWMKESDGGLWFLYLATPLVGEEGGKRPAYGRINEVLREMPQPLGIDPVQIKVVRPSGAVAQAILELQRRYPGRRLGWYDGASIGGVSIDRACIYPPVLAATRLVRWRTGCA
jgi:hypothetical protein